MFTVPSGIDKAEAIPKSSSKITIGRNTRGAEMNLQNQKLLQYLNLIKQQETSPIVGPTIRTAAKTMPVISSGADVLPISLR